MRICVKVMFFDSSRDYLPHYRMFELKVNPNETLRDLLKTIKAKDEEFDYNERYPLAKIGFYLIPPNVTLGSIVEHFGSEFFLDPASKYRTINDFVIDESDFFRSFKLLEPYMDMEDRFYFLSNKDLHYASASFEFDKEYIGDALLACAHRMIKKGNPHKEEILNTINSHQSGIWSCEYENLLFLGKNYSEIIEELKSWLEPPKRKNTFLRSFFAKKKDILKVERLNGVPVALYGVDSRYLKEQGAIVINYARAWRKAGESLVDINPELAFKKGAALLLDAMDSGAELLVTNETMADYFRSHFGDFERTSGREIYIDIISIDELKLQRKEKNESRV